MKAIVAVDKNWGIGKKNDLLFSLPADMLLPSIMITKVWDS